MKSKLIGPNLVKVVTTQSVSLLRYLAAFVAWAKYDLAKLDRTRKEFNINGGLSPREEVATLYILTKERGRRLILIKSCMVLDRDSYTGNSEESLLKAA